MLLKKNVRKNACSKTSFIHLFKNKQEIEQLLLEYFLVTCDTHIAEKFM